MDYIQVWINFLRSSAEDLEKSLPRAERYTNSSVLIVLIGAVTGVVSWFGGLGEWWQQLIGGIMIAIIIIIVGILGLVYAHHLQSERSRISQEKDNVLTLIAMILGKRVISPEEIYNEWQKCKKNESFKERKEEIESVFKIRNSPENVSLEDVKRGFKQLDEQSQEKYMKYLFEREDHNEEIEEWLSKNYKELSERVCIENMIKD